MGLANIRTPAKPFTDYDKTLHNRLRPRDKPVTQNLYKSDVRQCLAKHMKYKASSFIFIFSSNSPTEVTRHKIWYDDAE